MIQSLEILELLIVGALLGGLGGLLGIGGGLFAIPVLGVLFGLDEQHAQGTGLVMVVPNVAVGLWNYAKRGKMDPRIGFSLAVAALPFTYVGAHVATHVASTPLRIAFAMFTLCIAASTLLLVARPALTGATRRVYPWQLATVVGAFGGILSGLFSVGGAIFAVPLVSMLFGLSQTAAQGFGLALVAPGTVVGIVTYALAGDVDWRLGLPLAIGGVLAVPYGVQLAHRLPERVLRSIFAGLMIVSAAALIAKA